MSAATMDKIHTLLKGWGYKVEERSGWKTRKASTIAFAPQLVIEHHTGGPSTPDALLAGGRSDLKGPLCHWTIDKDGTIRAIAAGYANHAGINNRAAVEKGISAPPLTAEIKPGVDTAGWSANRRAWGIEVKTAAAFSTAQDKSTIALEAAICLVQGWTTPRVIAHREATRRKPDPVHSMAKRRTAVAELMRTKTAKPPVVKVPTLARVATLNCLSTRFDKASPLPAWSKRRAALAAHMRSVNASIWMLQECSEAQRTYLRSKLPGGAARWKVWTRGDQAILWDSSKWIHGSATSLTFGGYAGALWVTLTRKGTKAKVTVACYHLEPNSVASQASQKAAAAKLVGKLPAGPLLVGGDGADSPAWLTGLNDARTAAASSPNRQAGTYTGGAITDRIHVRGIKVRGYQVFPTPSKASDHNPVLAQITINA